MQGRALSSISCAPCLLNSSTADNHIFSSGPGVTVVSLILSEKTFAHCQMHE